jgi:uracil-DNA glycosylase family 4
VQQLYEYQLPANFELDPDALAMAPVAGSTEEPSIFDRYCAQLGYPSAEILAKVMLLNPVFMPVVDKKGNSTQPVLWLPGHTYGNAERGPIRHYDIMAVGKMPGPEELERQLNFAGPAGKLLRDIANSLGYHQLNNWYFTNIVRFIPPTVGKAALPNLYVEICFPLLLQEIALVKPRILVLMGADAVKAVAGKHTTLSNMRSSVFVLRGPRGIRQPMENYALLEDKPEDATLVCATIHPAAVLRENGLMDGLTADLTRIRDLHIGRDPTVTDLKSRDYFYVRTHEELRGVVDAIFTQTGQIPIAVDCETGGRDFRTGLVRSIQFSWAPRTACVVILANTGGEQAQSSSERALMVNELRRLFTDPRAQLIFHNGRFEAKWLGHLGLEMINRFYFDTMLADHCLNANAEHGLEALSIRYTNMGRYDWELAEWVKAHGGMAMVKERGYLDVPEDILLPYAACDTDCTWRCYRVLSETLERPENKQLRDLFFNVIMPCNAPLHEMERLGVLVDRDRLVELTHRFHERKERLVQHIRMRVGDDSFNPRSTQQKAKLLFENLGLPPYKTTGKPSRMWVDLTPSEVVNSTPAVDLETLEAIQANDKTGIVQLLHDFAVVDQVCKQFLTYEDGVEGGLIDYISSDGRIHTSFSQTSETGREKSSDPNCQNLPKAQEEELRRILGSDLPSIRSAFIAPQGSVIIEADYKSAEIFTLGYLSNCPKLIRDASSDLHARGAVNYFGAPRWKGFEEGKKPPGDWKEQYGAMRVAAKTINFGIAYQRGAKAVARAIIAETGGKLCPSPEEAQEFIDGFYNTYPEVRDYVDYCKTSVVQPGYVSNAYGRRRRFMAQSTDERGQLAAFEREAVNMPIQGTVADTLNAAISNMFRWRSMYAGRCNYRIILVVHDAVLIEVPGEEAHIVYNEVLPQCMTTMAVVPPWYPWPHTIRKSEPFTLDVDREVYIRWGVKATKEELVARGVSTEHAELMTKH